MFYTSSNEEVPSFKEDFTSWRGLDKQSQNLDDTREDHICSVGSGDDYDSKVLSVAVLPKRRRSNRISIKQQKGTRMTWVIVPR